MSVHINFGSVKTQVLKEHAVKRIIVVLSRMGKNAVKIFSALFYNGSKTDYLGAGADDYEKFKFSVAAKCNVRIIEFHLFSSTFSE